MPAVPFAADTWKLRSAIPVPTIGGTYSGIVAALAGGSFDPESGVIQVFSQSAHDFRSFFNTALASVDGGLTWTETYRGDALNGSGQEEVVFQAFTLNTPSGKYHYQARYRMIHAFLLADGTLPIGGIRLYVSQNGTNFTKLQDLYVWGQVNADPAASGGQAAFNVGPSLTPPILIEGSGPDGEDAYWLATSFSLDAGGTNNPITVEAADLWRSLDGFTWEIVRDLTGEFGASHSFFYWLKSTSGRLFLAGSGIAPLAYTDDDDLLTATWSFSTGMPTPIGAIIPMYGGTLVSNRNGTLISGGFVIVSCDDGGSFAATPTTPTIPTNFPGFLLKLGPVECILLVSDAGTNNICHYSNTGGETFEDAGTWLVSSIAERTVAAFVQSDGRPLVITSHNCFISTDRARGTIGTRTICPLANASLAPARPLLLCGNALANDLCTE